MSDSIERQYLSPNCILSLQGFTDQNNSHENQPILSVLSQAQCQIIGHPVILSGGLVFMEHLIKAVSAYAQELLSGLNHSWEYTDDTNYISISKIPDKNRHLLVWQEKKDDTNNQLQIELSTVQFFDLLETIDQLSVDDYTLPQLQDNPQPLSPRHRQGDISLIEQSTPAVMGFFSLALAAIALFMIPNPSTIKDPNQEPKPTPTQNNNGLVPPSQLPNQP
ncbi:hypothetical protein GM3708_3487 [Geminocystis sp. NIES-3708]|uniref:DUF4335 domain-containing protein n=1 Tax=Geminocystis sp. NIES-3708 TaxID=1615909 RepID=UPI0005FC7781|nr:DUF4335 domain-containing protein [Geminocystis sp. NIES-3708]BAQ63081.1 hypothetical protein GM3708_3487 [Geminocystis sp. NIES-3708]